MNERVPDLLVEQLHLGELPEAQAQAVRARLIADEDPRLEALSDDDAAILRDYPADAMARRMQARLDALEDPTPTRWPLWALGGALATAAAVALVWTLSAEQATVPPEPSQDRIAMGPGPGGERIKGDASIVLQRRDGSRAETLLAGASVSPGDTIQVGYRAGGWAHGVLVSVDGAGEVTLHFPAAASEPTTLRPRGNAVLHAFELDDAPAFERFYFFTASDPLDVDAVMDRVRDDDWDPTDPRPAEAVVALPLTRVPEG